MIVSAETRGRGFGWFTATPFYQAQSADRHTIARYYLVPRRIDADIEA